MGATGSGKSTFINLVSGSNLGVSDGLRSCTASVQASNAFQFEGHTVTLLDTPGFDDTTRTDTDILKTIAEYLATAYRADKRLHGIVYMHRISDIRMGGTSRRNFSMFRTLCGDTTLRAVVLVTNMWGAVAAERGAARERELAADPLLFQPVLTKGARMRRHDGTVQSAQAVLRLLVGGAPAVLQIQDELVGRGLALEQTAAAAELGREIEEARRRHREEMERAQRDAAAAVEAREEETRREMERVRREAEAEAERARAEHERLMAQQAEERRQAEEREREVQRRLEEEGARVGEEQERLRQEREHWANEQNRGGDGGCKIL
ncbi:P-loop containing nucleoside triphosphate hydrolase protein [Amylocystis lapponica]|nr:P-loop containing nucleoside triphosphate hydrolase protein [Amylocystis lapponica]